MFQAKSLQRELSNMQNCLEKLHAENRNIMNEQHRKDLALKAIDSKVAIITFSVEITL